MAKRRRKKYYGMSRIGARLSQADPFENLVLAMPLIGFSIFAGYVIYNMITNPQAYNLYDMNRDPNMNDPYLLSQ